MGGLVGVFWSRRMGELSGDMSRADKVGPERVCRTRGLPVVVHRLGKRHER
jgi:hypothetical protein